MLKIAVIMGVIAMISGSSAFAEKEFSYHKDNSFDGSSIKSIKIDMSIGEIGEALLIGRRFGLDPSLIVDILNASTGRNNSTELKAKQFILSGTFASGFSLGLMAKDLRTAADLAEHLGVGAPMARAACDLWASAQGSLGPDADHTEIFRFVEALDDPER